MLCWVFRKLLCPSTSSRNSRFFRPASFLPHDHESSKDTTECMYTILVELLRQHMSHTPSAAGRFHIRQRYGSPRPPQQRSHDVTLSYSLRFFRMAANQRTTPDAAFVFVCLVECAGQFDLPVLGGVDVVEYWRLPLAAEPVLGSPNLMSVLGDYRFFFSTVENLRVFEVRGFSLRSGLTCNSLRFFGFCISIAFRNTVSR